MSNQPPDDDYHYDVFLSYTRNLVGDWVQNYFLELFKVEGFRTKANTGGLVIPVIARDGRHHPAYIRDVQSVDFRRFVKKGDALTNSPRYIEFQDEMENWTEQVAATIRKAPLWKSNWPDETAIEIPELEPLEFNIKPRIR